MTDPTRYQEAHVLTSHRDYLRAREIAGTVDSLLTYAAAQGLPLDWPTLTVVIDHHPDMLDVVTVQITTTT
jgi:hypothetical protein